MTLAIRVEALVFLGEGIECVRDFDAFEPNPLVWRSNALYSNSTECAMCGRSF
jgi:hypothetical protein